MLVRYNLTGQISSVHCESYFFLGLFSWNIKTVHFKYASLKGVLELHQYADNLKLISIGTKTLATKL